MAESPHTHVLFESPHRLVAALKDAVEVLGAERPVAVGRELTKKFEEVVRGSAGRCWPASSGSRRAARSPC